MESKIIKELTRVELELTKLAKDLLDLEERPLEIVSLTLSVINLSKEIKKLLEADITCVQVSGHTEDVAELTKRIQDYKSSILLDPLGSHSPFYVNHTNLEEVKDLNEPHSCRTCEYAHGKYRCIIPEQPEYYIENNCPYYKNI